MRLLLRIGALLETKRSFTTLALDRLLGDDQGRKLLADRRLGLATPTDYPSIAAEFAIDDLVLLDEAHGAEPGWHVLALTDEVSNPLSTPLATADLASRPADSLPALVGSLSPALREPVEGFMHARADDQRAAALERLRYAAPPLSVVGELMPLLLSDSAELVRERAIALIGAAGGHPLVIDLIRAMQRRDEASIIRLTSGTIGLVDEQQHVVLSAAIAQCARGEATQGVIGLCAALTPTLAKHRQLDRLLDILLPTAFSLIDLVRKLQHIDVQRMRALLMRSMGFGAEQDARIIVLLAAPGETCDDTLLIRGVDLLLESGEAPRVRMPLAAALRRMDLKHTLAGFIARRGMRLGLAHDTAVHWLIAELCRDKVIDIATANELADILRRLLREAPGPHLVGALEQQLPVLLPCQPEVRATLVDPLIEIASRYRAERTTDLIVNAISGIGSIALPSVWDALERHPMEHVRLLMATLLPDLMAKIEAPERRTGILRLLAGLDRAEQGSERGVLVLSAARCAQLPPLDSDTSLNQAIDAAANSLGNRSYIALGYIAAAPSCDHQRRDTIVQHLLHDACAELPDLPSPAIPDPATGEMTFHLDEQLASHTEHVPNILAALARIGGSPHCAPDVLSQIVDRLVSQWRNVASWKLIWGPGNVHELAKTLSVLAANAEFPGSLRVRIAEALVPQIGQLPVARALARILTIGEGPYLARLAGRAAEELVRLAASGRDFAEDEREELVETLVDFLAVSALGAEADQARRRLVGVISMHRDHASSRARARLRYLMAELPPDVAARLDWA